MLFLSGSVSLVLNEKMEGVEEIEQLPEEKGSFEIRSSTTCQNVFP